jgi:hypothetical protein
MHGYFRAELRMTDSPIVDVHGQPLMAESRRMLEYLRERGRTLTTSEIVERMKEAAQELEEVVATVEQENIRRVPFPGKWHVADVVDHMSQTQIRGAEELRHLLSGRRPPGPPVYEALKSGASAWAPWPNLVAGLKEANREMLSVIEGSCVGLKSPNDCEPVDRMAAPTVSTIVVASCRLPDERVVQQIFVAELDWKEYALLQRLHLLDHRTQIRKLLKACHVGRDTMTAQD